MKSREDINVHPADKGGGIAVLDKMAYVDEMNRILSDVDTYIPLHNDLTTKYKKELAKIIDSNFRDNILT